MKAVARVTVVGLVLTACSAGTPLTTTTSSPPAPTPTTSVTTTVATTIVTPTTDAPIKDDEIVEESLLGRWVLVLYSLPTDSTTEQEATAVASTIPDAAVLLSDDYPSLNPGYWVVYRLGYPATGTPGGCPAYVPTDATCYPRWLGDPVVAVGSVIVLIQNEFLELTSSNGAIRSLGHPGVDARIDDLNLTSSRDGLFYSLSYEDSWYSCDSPAGEIYYFDIATQQSQLLGSGYSPTLSPDGSKLAWLTYSDCGPDPANEAWVYRPVDTIVVRDTSLATERAITMTIPLVGSEDLRELWTATWTSNEDLVVIDFAGSLFQVAPANSSINSVPLLEGLSGAALAYGQAGLIMLDDSGGEGDAFEWWLLGLNLETAAIEFLWTGSDYITVGVSATGDLVVATKDTYWPNLGESFQAPGRIDAIDW